MVPCKTINILGQDYNLKFMDDEEYPKLAELEANGLFEAYSKEIIINSGITNYNKKNFEKIYLFEKKVIRHEIIHAFFFESGLTDYVCDERLIDWLALQIPKMSELFDEMEVMG